MSNLCALNALDTVIKVFIFEDSWMCQEALVAVLGQEANLQIVGAAAIVADGLAALPMAKPDVVVMDLRFGQEVQGITATRQVKALLPDAQVVIFTDFPQGADLEEAIQASATGFLLKNEVQDPAIVVNAIHTVYRGEAYLTPTIATQVLQKINDPAACCGVLDYQRTQQAAGYVSRRKINSTRESSFSKPTSPMRWYSATVQRWRG